MARRAADHGPPQGPVVDDWILRERPALAVRGGRGEDLPATVTGGEPGAHLDVRIEDGDLRVGSVVEVVYARWEDATYRFSTRVIEVLSAPGCHRLAWPLEIHREQHRNHVRATMAEHVELAVAGPQPVGGLRPPGKGPAPGWHEADLVDLSGGGAAVVAPAGLRAGQIVLLRGEVAGREGEVAIGGRARVVRAAPATRRDGTPGTVAAYGLEFVDLPSVEQDRLVGTILWRKTTGSLR